ATPKLPPPAPRHAQKRSVLLPASAAIRRPPASTISTDTRLSQAMPYLRARNPKPPPSALPATPTVGHEPPGTASSRAPTAWYTLSSVAPPPTATVRAAASTRTSLRRRVSMTRLSLSDKASYEWPPPRTEN